MMYLLLLVGFVLLVKGADWFVDGSSSIAKTLKVPTLIIGLTIVAFGTSAPEAAVSTTAALTGSNDIAISNVIGSNIFNLLVVTGVCAIIKTMHVQQSILKKEFPQSILAAAGVLLVCVVQVFMGLENITIFRLVGVALLIFFILFVVTTVKSALKSRKETMDAAAASGIEEEEIKTRSIGISILLIVVGIVGIVLGGDLVVDSASDIAATFGLSETLIGLTIVAFGTSLPELVTSAIAAVKGESDMALGNVIGSNLFNLLLVLGLSTSISPITVQFESVIDLVVLIVASIVVLFFASKDKKIKRAEGIVMVVAYFVYTAYIIMR